MLDGGSLHTLLAPLMAQAGVEGQWHQGFVQYHVPPELVADVAKELWIMGSETTGKTRIQLEYLFQGFISLGG